MQEVVKSVLAVLLPNWLVPTTCQWDIWHPYIPNSTSEPL